MLIHAGEWAALVAAIFWTVTALAFENASKRIGSLSVNLLRLLIAFLLFGVLALIRTGSFFPIGASQHNWIWLSVSGLVGFVIGDLMLFQAYVIVGARVAMLIMSLSPPLAALIGWIIMGETINWQGLLGMFITMAGISLVILVRQGNKEEQPQWRMLKKVKLKYPLHGILLALGGAVGQATGLVLSKYGMGDYDVISATQIRVITGAAGFLIIFTAWNRWNKLKVLKTDYKALWGLGIGSIFGPFLGVSFSLIAVKFAAAGIASSIMSIVPVLIILPAVFLFHEKVTFKEILGAVVTTIGVVFFFL